MPRGYDNPQNLRSPTDPIEDNGPGLRHESMQAGSTRGSGSLKLTGGGNGVAIGSAKKKSKIPGGTVGPYNNLSNVRGTAGVIPIPKRKSEGASTEDTQTPKKPRSMRLEGLQSHAYEVHRRSLLSDPPEDDDDDEVSEISPHFAPISVKGDNADSKARTLQKLDQRAQELNVLSALNGLSAFVDNISISPQRLGGKRLVPARPEAPKARPTRGLHSRNQKYEVKPKPTTIPLVIFQRGKHVVQDESTVLVLEKPTNIDDIIVTPTNNHGSYSIASFGLHDMGSHFNVCRETRTFCITLRSQYADFPPKQRVMFTTRDESGVDQFINIVQQRRGVTPNNLSEKSVKAWTGETQRLVENHGARPTPPPTDEEQEVQEQVLLEQQQQKDEELSRQMHRDENRRVTRASTMRGHKTEFSSPLKPKTNGANSEKFAAALPRNRQSMRLKEPSSPKISPPKAPRLKMPSKWKSSLLFPFEGPRRANVDYVDLDRLNDEEFLNDNIMNFYLRYLEVEMAKRKPELAKKTHFFNTYFYERLSSKGDEEARLKAVLKWTNKIDIFSKDYIIIPINESSHWYLALVCNLCHLKRRLKSKDAQGAEDTAAESDATIANETTPPRVRSEPTSSDNDTTAIDSQLQVVSLSDDEPEWPEEETAPSNPELEEKNRTFRFAQNGLIDRPADKKKRERVYDPPDTPCIIILDSMGSGGTVRHGGALKHIRTWLTAEASQKRCLQLSKDHIKNIYGKAPNQTNWYDCGLFVLHYVERFIDEAESFVTGFLKGRTVDQTLWDEESIHDKRLYLFNLINKLHDEFVEFEKKKKLSVTTVATTTTKLKQTTPDTTTPVPSVSKSLSVCDDIEDIPEVVQAGLSTSPQPAELSHRQYPEISSDTTSSITSDAPTIDAKDINGMGIYDSVYPPSSTTTIPDTPPLEDQTTISNLSDDLEKVDQVPVPPPPSSPSVTRSQSKREPSLSSAWGLVATSHETSPVPKSTLQPVPEPASPKVKFNEEEHVQDEEVNSSNFAASKRRLKKRLPSVDKDEDDDVVMIEAPQKRAKIMDIPESQEL